MSDPIIIDNGSYKCAIGNGGDDNPMIYVRYESDVTDPTREKGLNVDWEAVARQWDVKDLADATVLLTQPPSALTEDRRRIIGLMFEKMKVGSLAVVNQPLLALFANGKTTGAVVDVGHYSTHASVINNGVMLKETVTRTSVGGATVSSWYSALLDATPIPSVDDRATIERIENIKRVLSYVKRMADLDTKPLDTSETYELPDGATITVDEVFKSTPTEVVFSPAAALGEAASTDGIGIHLALQQALAKVDPANPLPESSPILLVGGGSLLRGLSERFEDEVQKFAKQCPVEAPQDRRFSTWIGGSILSTINPTMFVSADCYKEYGMAVVETMMTS